MGDVIDWMPTGDIVEFEGGAVTYRQSIFNKCIDTFRQLQSAEADVVSLNDELMRLQRAYWDAKEDAEIVLAVVETANDQRSMLWKEMPEGETCLIVASKKGAFEVVLLAKRNRAMVTCARFAILKPRLAA